MIYILDTSFIVDIHRLHMPLATFPDFWEKLLDLGQRDMVSIPMRVYDEVTGFNDDLAEWIKKYKRNFIDQENIAYARMAEVMDKGYGQLDEDIVEYLKADPYVIAHALAVG